MNLKLRALVWFTVVFAAGLSSIQGQDEAKPGKKPLPDAKIQVEDDGKKGVVFRGVMEDVPLSEMLQLYSEYKKRKVIYDPKMIVGEVSAVAPREGEEVDMEEVLLSALAKFRLTLIAHDDFDQIVTLAEAANSAETVAIEELADVTAHKFVRTVVHLTNTSVKDAEAVALKLVTKSGGLAMPVEAAPEQNALVLCDYAENVRRILKLLEDLDSTPSQESRVIKLQHMKIEDVLQAVESAAGEDVKIGIVDKTNQLVLTGKPADVTRVSEVVSAIDVADD